MASIVYGGIQNNLLMDVPTLENTPKEDETFYPF
jgi:hypothetical protein